MRAVATLRCAWMLCAALIAFSVNAQEALPADDPTSPGDALATDDTPTGVLTAQQARAFANRLEESFVARPVPSTAATPVDLEGIVDEFADLNEVAEKSLIERFEEWLDKLFARNKEPAAEQKSYPWWKYLQGQEGTARVVFWVILLSLLSIVAVALYRELRGRPWRWPQFGRRKATPQKTRAGSSWPPDLSSLQGSARLSALFSALVDELTRRGRLPNMPGLTHRELSAALQPPQVQTFAELAVSAEAALYADAEPLAEWLSGATEKAQAVLNA